MGVQDEELERQLAKPEVRASVSGHVSQTQECITLTCQEELESPDKYDTSCWSVPRVEEKDAMYRKVNTMLWSKI